MMGIIVDAVSEVLNIARRRDRADAGVRRARHDRLHARHGQGEGHGQDPARSRPRARQPTAPLQSASNVDRPRMADAVRAPTRPSSRDRDLATIVRLVYEKSGITLHDGKRALVTARLQKRLRAGGFADVRASTSSRRARRDGRRADGAARRDRDQPHVVLPRAAALRVPRATVVLPPLRARSRGSRRSWAGARRARPAKSRTRSR